MIKIKQSEYELCKKFFDLNIFQFSFNEFKPPMNACNIIRSMFYNSKILLYPDIRSRAIEYLYQIEDICIQKNIKFIITPNQYRGYYIVGKVNEQIYSKLICYKTMQIEVFIQKLKKAPDNSILMLRDIYYDNVDKLKWIAELGIMGQKILINYYIATIQYLPPEQFYRAEIVGDI